MFVPPSEEQVPTDEQEAIIQSSASPLKVIAFAGTGKTTTLLLRSQRESNKRHLYLAFNKSVEEEAKRKFPGNVTSRTIHALAFQAVGKRYKVGKLSPYQVSRQINLPYYNALIVIRTLENWLISADQELGPQHAARDFLTRYKGAATSRLMDAATALWNTMLEGKLDSVPMTHSGYLKLFQLSNPELRYDTILLDEAQDTNLVTHELVMSQSKHSDIIVVGDDFQAIYAWRGAVSALSRIQAETLYLTQSFRFGQAVADVANGILSRYFALPKRMQGTGQTEVGYVDTRKRHTIVSRTNSHLSKRASELCQHARLHIAGGNGNGELPIFGTLMDIYHLWRNQKFEIRDPEVKCFESYEQAKSLAESEMLDHEYAVALRIVEEFGTTIPKRIEDIKAAMEHDPDQSDVYLTTTHKAKGGEWDRVIVADDFPKLFDKNGNLIPLGFDEGQLDPQEINLIYVAATRAKQQLQINPDIRRLIGGVGNHGFDRPGRGESQAGTGGSESSNGLNEK